MAYKKQGPCCTIQGGFIRRVIPYIIMINEIIRLECREFISLGSLIPFKELNIDAYTGPSTRPPFMAMPFPKNMILCGKRGVTPSESEIPNKLANSPMNSHPTTSLCGQTLISDIRYPRISSHTEYVDSQRQQQDYSNTR